MLIDTHCHLDEYENIEDVIERSKLKLEKLITIGCCYESSKKAKSIADNSFIFYTAGVHPNYSNLDEVEKIEDLLAEAAAIGEIGLDYYRSVDKGLQKDCFIKQLRLANKYDLPVVVHGRDAYEDILEIFSRKEFQNLKFIMHSYAGSFELIQNFLDRAYISFSGIVTFKNALLVQETAFKTPIDRILVETDSPYLSPIRGKQNFPENVILVAEKIANIKRISFEEVVEKTNFNSKKAFII